MTILEKLEDEFKKDSFIEKQAEEHGNREQIFSKILQSQDYEALLSDNLKNEIKWLIEMLQDFYDSKINKPDATVLDAIDYIPLFCINGALISSMMNIPYEDYLKLVDVMIVILGIQEE